MGLGEEETEQRLPDTRTPKTRVEWPISILEGVVASLARELAQQLIAIHELPALDALDASGELGLLLGGEFEPLIIFLRQDRYGRALLQALAFDLDPSGDDLACDQLHHSPQE